MMDTSTQAKMVLPVAGLELPYTIETQEPLPVDKAKGARRKIRAVAVVIYKGERRTVQSEWVDRKEKALRGLYDELVLRHERGLAQMKSELEKLARWNAGMPR